MQGNAEQGHSRLDEFAQIIADAQDTLQRAGQETGERARELQSQVEAKLHDARRRAQELQDQAIDGARAAARATDEYAHENPWPLIGVAAVAGLVAGLLLNRR